MPDLALIVTLLQLAAMKRTKLGDRLHARDQRAQEVEVTIGSQGLTGMLALGRPKSRAVGGVGA